MFQCQIGEEDLDLFLEVDGTDFLIIVFRPSTLVFGKEEEGGVVERTGPPWHLGLDTLPMTRTHFPLSLAIFDFGTLTGRACELASEFPGRTI